MSFLAASPTSAEQSVAAAMSNAVSVIAQEALPYFDSKSLWPFFGFQAVTTDSTASLGTLRQVQMQTTLLPAMCPSQFTQQQAVAAAAQQQQLQLAQPPGLASKNKGDQRVEVNYIQNL